MCLQIVVLLVGQCCVVFLILGLARTNILVLVLVLVLVSDTEALKMQDVKIQYIMMEQVLLMCFEVKSAFYHCWAQFR